MNILSRLFCVLACPLLVSVSAGSEPVSESNSYFLRLLTQTFDGERDFSHSQIAAFARVRDGNESFSIVDYGNGSVAIQRQDGLAASDFMNSSGPEQAFHYNYETRTIEGDSIVARYHNQFIRPYLGNSPALGQDATWQQQLPLSAVGENLPEGTQLNINLSRDYFTHEGTDYVVVRYAIEPFQYKTQEGLMLVQWGQGISLTDPGFGQIYWNAALHRAALSNAIGETRPYRYNRTMVGTDGQGQPFIDPRSIPQIAGDYQNYYSESAQAPIPFEASTVPALPLPLNLASNLDTFALSLGEDGANQAPELTSGHTSGQRGDEHGVYVGGVGGALADTSGYFAKFSAAAKGIVANSEALSAFEAQFGSDFLNQAQKLDRQALALQADYRSLTSKLSQLEAKYHEVDALLTYEVNKDFTFEELYDSPRFNPLFEEIEELPKQIEALKAEVKLMEAEAVTMARVREKLGKATEVFRNLPKNNPKIARIAQKFSNGLSRLEGPLGFLDGVLTVAGTYTNAASLGHFDPSDKDLHLSGSYDSVHGFVGDISLNLLGILGNAAQGNLAATTADTLAFASGRFTDLYKTYQAAEYARGQSRQAHMDFILTLKKQTLQLSEIEAQKLRELMEQEYGLYTDEDPYADGYDTTDPRFDPETGLPKPDYWAWLKKNRPNVLENMGIDPNAPVGGWPPDQDNGPTQQELEEGLADEINKPQYPTAPPRVEEPADPETPADPAEIQLPQIDEEALARRQEMQRRQQELWELQQRLIEQRERERERGRQPGDPSNPSTLELSDLEISELVVSKFNLDPVEFEMPVFENPEFELPEFALDDLKLPPTSDLTLKPLGGDSWMSQINNPAFENMDLSEFSVSGTVETSLERWEAWLATQNVRQLERWAIAAGYPNLPSALDQAPYLISLALDDGFRQWAMSMPPTHGYTGATTFWVDLQRRRSLLALGDTLADSRAFFSSGGLSDVTISSSLLSYAMRDFGLVDGDIVDILVQQYGNSIFNTRLTLKGTNTTYNVPLSQGLALLSITAVNEGTASPNTAEININNVVKGDSQQTYNLNTGETATLRISSGAQ